jgi:hypothetical protein
MWVIMDWCEDIHVFHNGNVIAQDANNSITTDVSRMCCARRQKTRGLQKSGQVLLPNLTGSAMLGHHCGKSHFRHLGASTS